VVVIVVSICRCDCTSSQDGSKQRENEFLHINFPDVRQRTSILHDAPHVTMKI
jgi:hypothetical protein